MYAPACSSYAAAGGGHMCSIREGDGSVWCWGLNSSGQLGDGTLEDSSVPVRVRDLEGVKTIALGFEHTCAALEAGGVRCWGENFRGQLGDETMTDSSVPVPVLTISDAVELTAGLEHTCALDGRGTIRCWGWNDKKQIGTPDKVGWSTPYEIPGITAASIAAGGDSTCAITTDRELFCWGNNASRQLVLGDLVVVPTPMRVTDVQDVASVALASSHLCAIATMTASGVRQVVCAGNYGSGRLGNNATTVTINSAAFEPVQGLPPDVSGMVDVAVGEEHSCVRDSTGQVWCWGANYLAQIASGDQVNPQPVAIPSKLAGSAQLVGGRQHTCVREDGALLCAGGNPYGQRGNGERTTERTPHPLSALTGVVAVAAGENQTCSVDNQNRVMCWGGRYDGEHAVEPVQIEGLPPGSIKQISAGSRHGCAIVADPMLGDQLWCWGYNSTGQLGDGTAVSRLHAEHTPGIVPKQVAAGASYTCAVSIEGQVMCWGFNNRGQAGPPVSGARLTPTAVVTRAAAVEVFTGESHTCALLVDGTAQCWGDNKSGQLGTGTEATEPVGVSDVTVVTQRIAYLEVHGSRTYAQLENGMVAAWGFHCDGSLGNGDLQASCGQHLPARLFPGSFRAITAGDDVTCGLIAGGDVQCWGKGHVGQLGGNSYETAWRPAPVPGTTGATSIATGEKHTCAVRDGEVACWGNNATGQLGNGIITRRRQTGVRLVCD